MNLTKMFKGKQVDEIIIDNQYRLEIIFTDKSKLSIEADGSEGSWLDINFDIRFKGSL